jgi:hypothetical protein
MSRAAIGLVAALGLAGYVFIYTSGRAAMPIRSDGFSYYVYLPSWFIHHDATLQAAATDCCGGEFPGYTAMFRWPRTRRWVNPHPIGVALLQAPFFLLAHGLTKWTNLSPDGFSLYYQHAIGLSGLVWTIAGLFALRDLLKRHFTDAIVAATLIAIAFGTNLFHYATYDSSYSHAYSFFLFAAFLNLTGRWHRTPTLRTSLLIGVVAGLIVLVRHTNALFLIVLPLYGLRRAIDQAPLAAAAAAAAVAVVVPQSVLYWMATGRPVVSAYGDLGFNFADPHLSGVLFSARKGLFFWSPLLLVAIAGWIVALRRRDAVARLVLPSAIFFVVNTWIIASWWDWQFGGSYGHRGFVDLFPAFALGLAVAFEWAGRAQPRRAAMATVAAIAIGLSIFQMLQYWNGVIPIKDMTWDRYRALFLQWH